ncbi:MAG TPA: ABC transporter substrate-binding protein [Casimicrobiaceae bacterium]|nr:ABC transporter substrate-binding protein [Casimicrobiaceae bacterium]
MRFAYAFAAALAAVSFSAGAADSAKVLRTAFQIAESSFDPVLAWDAASNSVVEHISESMLEYEYLARPVKLAPLTLERMPEVSNNGATYLCRVRKGIFFAADPAFKGKPRELTAGDYAYSMKRLLDPALKSPWTWLMEGKLVGGDELLAAAKKTGKLDYDAPVAGLEIVDRYTLRIRLKQPDYTFLYVLAMPATAAVAREVIEAYGIDSGAHPVGTGPYLLREYQRSHRIVLEANPGYRKVVFDEAIPANADDAAIARSLKGKQLPLIGRIEIAIIEEDQPRWLAFLKRELDYLQPFPRDFLGELLDKGKLRPELAAKGIRHELLLRPNAWWEYFNMEDPVVGGYTPEKIALRRAISMSFNVEEFIRVIYHGRAVPAQGPVPPDIAGYDPAHKTQAQVYDPAAARALLDRFGYKDRDGDGYRELPDGKPLVIERWSTPSLRDKELDELWRKNMDAIGIRMVFKKDKLPEIRKMARLGKIQTRTDGWNADYPDADNFMQNLYGGNIGQSNDSRFNLPEFNQLYEQTRKLPDSPERTKLYDRMTDLVVAYAPWKLTHHLLEDHVIQPWVVGYKPHPIRSDIWKYLDIDLDRRRLQ